MLKYKQNNRNKAFTLIELLVVISIIGLLSTIAIGSFNKARMKARDVKRMYNLKIIADAVERYNIDNGSYPSTILSGSCSDGNIVNEYDSTICTEGTIFHKGSNIYLTSIPKPDIFKIYYSSGGNTYSYDFGHFYYEDNDYYGYDLYVYPPCMSVSLEDGSSFVCERATCFISNAANSWRWCM